MRMNYVWNSCVRFLNMNRLGMLHLDNSRSAYISLTTTRATYSV